jgi:hypothetical protein
MTDYILTNEQKKRLTEFLGQKPDTECDHDKVPKDLNCLDRPDLECDSCQYHKLVYRTFTTPQDAHDLAKKLVEVDRDVYFEKFAEAVWVDRDRNPDWGIPDLFLFWLLTNPARFCYLVNAYLEAG